MPDAGTAPLKLAKAYIESGYRVDSSQRFEVGDGAASPAPRFLLLRTRLGCLWRFRADLDNESIGELSKLAGREGAVSPPLELAPPPERLEPMLQVLRRAGLETAAVRKLLLCRAGWVPGAPRVGVARLGADGDESVAGAQLGTVDWEQRPELRELEAREWCCFGDVVVFVDV